MIKNKLINEIIISLSILNAVWNNLTEGYQSFHSETQEFTMSTLSCVDDLY